MKQIYLVLILAAMAISAACAAPQAKYTLYFVDNTRNVCRVGVDVNGKMIGKPVKLTAAGGYDGFSVSPDEKRLVGFTAVKKELDKDTEDYRTTWKCFVEHPAVKNSRKTIRMMDPLMSPPVVYWSTKGNYFMLRYGYTDTKTDVYKFAGGQKVITDSTMAASISPDERYMIMENKYPHKPSGARVVELKTGKFVEFCERQCPAIWIGNTPKIAWIDSGSVFTGEIASEADGVRLLGPSKLSTAAYDLRYIPAKGLYFIMGDSRTEQLACYSQDLRTVTQGDMLPDRPDRWQATGVVKKHGPVTDDAVYSPDCLFVAFSAIMVKGKPAQVMIMDQSGKSVSVASGRSPQWKGPDNVWSPWQQIW